MRIERATAADAEALAPVFDAYRVFFAGLGDLAQSRRFLADRFARDDSAIFVARDATGIRGFIQLYPLWSSWYCRPKFLLSDLYVDEAVRATGVGARLVEAVTTYAREKGARAIMLELPRTEPHLAIWYAKLGFERDGVFELAGWSAPA